MPMIAYIVAALAWWSQYTEVPTNVTWNWGTQEQFAAQIEADVIGWSIVGSGHFTISRAHWNPMPRYERCSLVIHEVGHAIGFRHSEDPTNVMYERPAVPRQCHEAPFYRSKTKPKRKAR